MALFAAVNLLEDQLKQNTVSLTPIVKWLFCGQNLQAFMIG